MPKDPSPSLEQYTELAEMALPWHAAEVPEPRLLVLNDPLAAELGLDPSWLRTADGVRLLVGNLVPSGATPVAQGYAGQMVLSHDAACFNDWLPQEALPIVTPNWNYLHITKDVIPALKARGVTDEQVKQMMVDNPRRIFERDRNGY